MKLLLVLAAVLATAAAGPVYHDPAGKAPPPRPPSPDDRTLPLHLGSQVSASSSEEQRPQSLHPIREGRQRYRREALNLPHSQKFSASSSEEQRPQSLHLARWRPAHQGTTAVSAEDRMGRFERLHENKEGFQSFSSSEEQQKRPIHRDLWQDTSSQGQPQSFSSSSEEQQKRPVQGRNYWDHDPGMTLRSGVKPQSFSSSSEEALPKPIYRSGLQSSSSEEQKPFLQHGISPIKERQRYRREALNLHSQKFSSSSEEQQKRPIQEGRWGYGQPNYKSEGLIQASSSSEELEQQKWTPIPNRYLIPDSLFKDRFLGFFEGDKEIKKERNDIRDNVHKIEHHYTEHIGKERIGGAPAPTVLEGTYHVAYDPPTVVQAPTIA